MILLNLQEPIVEAMATAMETILAELEHARPARLAGKRTAFRRDTEGALNLRAELNVGWMLAQSGCAFNFGGESQPDFECSTSDGTAWVEVTTKSRDDLSLLHDELESAFRGRSVVVELRIPRQLVIPADQRRTACSAVLAAYESMENDHCSLPVPEIGSVTLTRPSLFGGAHVVLDISSDLTEHGEAIERFLANAISDKVEQSPRGEWSPNSILM